MQRYTDPCEEYHDLFEDPEGEWVKVADIPLEALRALLGIAEDTLDYHDRGEELAKSPKAKALAAAMVAVQDWLGA